MQHAQRFSYSILGAILVSGLGCGDTVGESVCGADLAARAAAVQTAAEDLSARANAINSDVLAACRGIATDLGETVPSQGTMSDSDYLMTVCTLASDAIDAEVSAGATIAIAAQPPLCTVDASAQLRCDAACDVTGTCEPGTVEARCQPGELSVRCEGMCEANAYCEADAGASVTCEGSCEGRCDGTCTGNSNGAGECDGTCSGRCEGTCQVTASGGVDCGAEARCRGGCMGTATAPECRAELMPPMCDLDANCEAACDSQAQFSAECQPGQIAIDVQGESNAMLATTLEANLPALLAIRDGVGGFVDGAAGFATQAAGVGEAITGLPACAAAIGAQFTSAISGAVEASASITVSVSASASVSGSAG